MAIFRIPPKSSKMTTGTMSAEQLEALQHFAELGRLSASLLHEISNPLTAAIIQLDQYSDSNLPGVRQAQHSLKLMHRYVDAAKQQVRLQSAPKSFGIRTPIEQVKRLVMPVARNAGVQVMFDAIPRCRLYGDSVKFQQILANLIMNAIEAYRNDTSDSLPRPVHVHLKTNAKYLTIRVADWGEGIAANQLAQLFKPFYSTKEHLLGYGLGIGLTIVQQYVTIDFGGSIRVTSSRRHGTQFYIKLPVV